MFSTFAILLFIISACKKDGEMDASDTNTIIATDYSKSSHWLSLPVNQRDALVAGAPTLDAVAAFDYYIKHYNKGRPFILAGHSQGSEVLRNLLSGYMKDNPAVYSKMIAAYAIGTSISPAYLAANPHLHFATTTAEGLGSYMPDSEILKQIIIT